MELNLEDHPENLILPFEVTKVIYSDYDAQLTTQDQPGQVYGKALHGNGQIQFKNGNTYIGQIHNGMLHGKGKFSWINGIVYDGDFEYNIIKGSGQYFWPDQSTYTGQVLNGLRHGIGTYVSPNGDAEYTGTWIEGQRQGSGVIKFKSGTIFEGQFLNGCKQGHGRMTYPSGNYYEGDWKFDKKDGQGTMYWETTREKYYGAWSNNLQNGFGVHIWLDGKGESKFMRNRYEGQWVDGKRQGYGVFYYANGSKYEGEWANNLKEGYAIFTEDNGNLIQGIYKADKLLKNAEAGAFAAGAVTATANIAKDVKDIEKSSQISNPTTLQRGVSARPSVGIAAVQKAKLQQKQQTEAKDTAGAAAVSQKKKEIEANPYANLLDITDLTASLSEEVTSIHFNLNTMLLRHNSDLRNFYKLYCSHHDNIIGENSFSMDMVTFWRMLKEGRITDSTLTLASINRLFYCGVKNRFSVSSQEASIQLQIEMAKKFGRPLTHEELRDIAVLNLVSSAKQSADQSRIDYGLPESKFQAGGAGGIKQQNGGEKLFIDVIDIHASDRVVFFRHFIELIVRVSFLKYGDILNMHRSFEKFLKNKIIPIFEAKKLPAGKSQIHFEENEAVTSKKQFLVDHHKEPLRTVFNSIAQSNKNERFGLVDRTCKFKDLLKVLHDCELVSNDIDKKLLIQILEKTFDLASTTSHIDQIAKEKEKEEKDHVKKDTKDKKKKSNKASELAKQQANAAAAASSSQSHPPCSKYEVLKQEKLALLLDSEMLPFEVDELICNYLLKKEKELNLSRDDNDLMKKSKKYFDQLVSHIPQEKALPNAEASQNTPNTTTKKPKKEPRVWPLSIKDKLKDQLANERKRKEELEKVKKIKDEEKKKEQRERARMTNEDFDINSDLEYANEDDDEDENDALQDSDGY